MAKGIVLLVIVASAAAGAFAQSQPMKLPEIRNGQMTGGPPPPPPKSYPRMEDGRVHTSPNTSYGGSADPSKGSVQGNVQFPIPEKKK